MARFAYVRVSSLDQNEDRQMDAITVIGITAERIYTEKQSGKNTKRPELQALLTANQPGDSVTVESISRFARNTKDLLELVEQLTAKGVEFISLKERIDTTTPTGKFMLTIFGAVAELERVHITAAGGGHSRRKIAGQAPGQAHKKSPERLRGTRQTL